MSTLTYSYNLTNGTTADANEVMGNFNSVAAVLNGAVDSSNMNLAANFVWTGTHQFDPADLKIEGAGAGVVSLQYDNSANSRTVTFPDMGTAYDVFPLDRAPIGTIVNARMNLSSGTFSVLGADGNALSASNKCKAVIKTSVGNPLVVSFTTGPSFQDDAHASDSDFVGTGTMSWGTTAAVAWANTMPFLIGICTADDSGTSPIMVIARGPVLTTGASTNIGYWDNAPSSASQNNVFALTTTNVTSTHASRPITWVGSFRMVKSASDDWTVQTLDSGDGFSNFYNFGTRQFDMVTGQMGATAAKYFLDNAGTAPTYTNRNNYKYSISMAGWLNGTYDFDNAAGGTAGAGAVNLRMALPLPSLDASSGKADLPVGSGRSTESAGTSSLHVPINIQNTSLAELLYQNTLVTAMAAINNADQSSTSRNISGSLNYKVFV